MGLQNLPGADRREPVSFSFPGEEDALAAVDGGGSLTLRTSAVAWLDALEVVVAKCDDVDAVWTALSDERYTVSAPILRDKTKDHTRAWNATESASIVRFTPSHESIEIRQNDVASPTGTTAVRKSYDGASHTALCGEAGAVMLGNRRYANRFFLRKTGNVGVTIGVAHSGYDVARMGASESLNEADSGYGFNTSTGDLHHLHRATKWPGQQPCGSGDTVTMELDLAAGSLSVRINDGKLQVMVPSGLKGPLVWCVELTGCDAVAVAAAMPGQAEIAGAAQVLDTMRDYKREPTIVEYGQMPR